MVRRLSVSVAIILTAIPLRAVKLSRKQGDLAGRNEIGHEGCAAHEIRECRRS